MALISIAGIGKSEQEKKHTIHIASEAAILGMLPNVCHYIVKPLFIVGSLTFTMFYDHHVLKHINIAKS